MADPRHEELTDRLEGLEKKVDKLAASVAAGFNRVDARFDRVAAEFDRVDARFEHVDDRFDRIAAEFDRVDDRFDRIAAEFDRVDDRFDRVVAQFDRVDARFDRVGADVDTAFAEQRQYTDFAFGRLSAELEGLRSEMRGGFDQVRTDFQRIERKLEQLIDTRFRQ